MGVSRSIHLLRMRIYLLFASHVSKGRVRVSISWVQVRIIISGTELARSSDVSHRDCVCYCCHLCGGADMVQIPSSQFLQARPCRGRERLWTAIRTGVRQCTAKIEQW